MINVSAAFKTALEDDNRNFSGSCTITLASGKAIPINDSQLWENGFVVDDSTSNTNGFDIGSAIVQKFTLRLNNMYDDFTDYDFTNAVISDVKVSLDLDGKTEAVNKGVFTVDDPSYDGDIITLECLDNMHKFDVSYEKSNLTYPATLLQIIQDACRCCGVTLATDSLQFEHYDYVISDKPDDSTMTFRDALTWVGQISGHFWKCNKDGQLTAGWYNMSDLTAGKNIHTLQTNVVADITADTDDVVITCVRVVTDGGESGQVTYQSGSDGYASVIDGNKFINSTNAAEIASMIGERVVGLRFRPMTVSSLQDPTIEAGDGAIVYDRKLKSYKTFFTNVVFSIDADNQMSNNAESALRNSAERFSAATKTYQKLRKQLQKNKTEWEKTAEYLENAMKNQAGLYPVIKTLTDGTKVYYMCDHSTMEESKVVFELNSKGWTVSTDGGNTWNAGLLVDGTMITKILNSIGINADWINTGAFTVLDSAGNIMFKADTATGKVDIVANSFQLGGKTIEDVAGAAAESAAKSYVDSAMQDKTGNWYGNYTPTLSNQPASGWKAADYEKHNGDTFINPSTGDVYIFSTGTAGLEITFNSNCKTESVSFDWVEIYYEDNGVKKALPKLGGSFGGKKVQVPGNVFWLYWRTDTSSCSFYGFKIDSIASIMLDKSQVSGTTKALPSYSVTNVSGSTYPESPNHNNYGNNINMLWKYTGTASSATAQWKKVAKVDVEELMKQLDQETIFNILTNNGEAKGIYLKDKQLYISFTYAQGGTLKLGGSNNGNGEMQILNSSNKVIGAWNNEGLTAKNGKIAAFTIDEYSLEYGKSINRGLLHAKTDSAVYVGEDGIIVSDGDTSTYGPHVVQLVDGKLYASSGAYLSCGDGDNTALTAMVLYDAGGTELMETGGNMLSFHNYVNFESDCTTTFYNKVVMRGDLDVRGSKSRRVDTKNYGERLQYCYETAMPYFGDMGHGTTDENGICLIEIDDIFQETVGTQEYLVFIQPEGEGNLYVNKTEKFYNYFVVRGSANLPFSWEVKCIQKEYEYERLEKPEDKEMLQIASNNEKKTIKILKQSMGQVIKETEESLWNLTDLQE